MIRSAAILLLAATLSGCVTGGGRTGPQLASVTPPPAGSAATPASAIIAAMGGGLVGGSIGLGLGAAERQRALEAEYRALEYAQAGQKVAWSGSGSTSGEVVAAQPYRVGSQDCRQYAHTISRAGEARSARGTACRNPDGSWTPLT